MKKEEIIEKIDFAKNKFLDKDLFLLSVDIHERTLTHKFAEYLQQKMDTLNDGWNVDCEYNRNYDEIKKINPRLMDMYVDKKFSALDTEINSIFPDIIIHKRNSDINLLVIEAKKSHASKSSINKDKDKLQLIKEQFLYNYAVFLTFDTINEDIEYEFI